MGSGRSGTSLMGGILKEAGYYMGDNLYPARNSNPKGFFENAEINGINELILADSFNKHNIFSSFSRGKNNIYNPGQGQRWLSYCPLRKRIDFINEEVKIRISEAVLKAPFAYKDPRFCFTLAVWERFVDRKTVFICVFREPGITMASILAECDSVKYLKNFTISKKEAYKVYVREWHERHDNSPPTSKHNLYWTKLGLDKTKRCKKPFFNPSGFRRNLTLLQGNDKLIQIIPVMALMTPWLAMENLTDCVENVKKDRRKR